MKKLLQGLALTLLITPTMGSTMDDHWDPEVNGYLSQKVLARLNAQTAADTQRAKNRPVPPEVEEEIRVFVNLNPLGFWFVHDQFMRNFDQEKSPVLRSHAYNVNRKIYGHTANKRQYDQIEGMIKIHRAKCYLQSFSMAYLELKEHMEKNKVS